MSVHIIYGYDKTIGDYFNLEINKQEVEDFLIGKRKDKDETEWMVKERLENELKMVSYCLVTWAWRNCY